MNHFTNSTKQTILVLSLLVAGLLTACQPIQPSASSTEPLQVSEQPVAAENIRTLLARQLHIDPATIEIVSAEAVEWTDSCLGVNLPTELCAATITPGYKVTLRAAGQNYVIHTDQAGSQSRLAAAPEAVTGELIIVWKGTVDHGNCLEATIGVDGVGFGLCDGKAKIGGNFAAEARQAVLQQWASNLHARIWNAYVSASADSATAGCPVQRDGQLLFLNAEHGYCLSYPATYTIFQPNPSEVVIALDSLLNVVDPRVHVTVSDAEGRTVEEIADTVMADFGGTMTERSHGELNGEPSVILDMLPGQEFNRRVLAVHNDRLYDLMFMPDDPAQGLVFEQMEGIYHLMIAEFRFVD